MRADARDMTKILNRAISAYKAGRLGDAEQLCREILSAPLYPSEVLDTARQAIEYQSKRFTGARFGRNIA